MNDDNVLVIARPQRPHLRPEERARVLALWTKSGLSAEEVARRTGVSRSSLGRWKRARSATSRTVSAVTRSPALVEVPVPIGGTGLAEVMTRGGTVRLFAAATPAWAAELIRELNRC